MVGIAACAARVLETVEKVLKEEATKRIDSADPEFKRCFGNIPSKGTFNKELDDDYIKVDLADFFHVISGEIHLGCRVYTLHRCTINMQI